MKTRVRFINKDVIALFSTLILSIFILHSRNSKQIQNIKFQILNISSAIAYPITWYNEVFTIREENKLLKDKLIQVNLLNSELQSFYSENKRLKEMLNFISSMPLNYMVGNIVGHNFGITTQSIIVDIGSKEGLSKNLTVMDENGLLGKTIKVGDHSSLVQLITDKNYRVSIRVGQERALGLFIPTHGKYGILDGVRKSLPLSEGEIAYTSGISEIYPANIPVAKVVSISTDNDNPFQNIIVELLGSINSLDYIFVIL
tara:strand:+ start:333 stop:1106 length:774 start_codon:yes stop_codon:yes gene_type:complete